MASDREFFDNTSADNLFSTAGNWTGALPVGSDNDFAILSGTKTNDNMLGETITSSTSGLTFQVRKDYSGSVGSSGTNLTFDGSEAPGTLLALEVYGSGNYWFDLASGETITQTRIHVPGRAVDQVNLNGAAGSSTYTKVYLTRGRLNLLGGTVTDMWTGSSMGPNSYFLDVQVGAAVTTLRQNGGRVEFAPTAFTTWDLRGGTATSTHNLTGTTLSVANGSYVWSPTGGTPLITNLFIYAGGTVDLTRTGDARVITNTIIFPGGTLNAEGVESSITFTNAPIQVSRNAKVLGDITTVQVQ